MEKLPNVSEEEVREKYDIVFIGGGPATLSFFSFMCRNKNFENFFSSLNILILEKSETFGSGCLGKYGINSNTSAEGFVRLICFNEDENGKEEMQNLSPNKKKVNEMSKNHFYNSNNKENNNNLNNSTTNFISSTIFQKFKNKCVPIFEDLLYSNETKNLLGIGSKTAPLSMIGNFLDCVGNSITSYIYNKFHKKIFMNYCEVMKINVEYDKCFEGINNIKFTDMKRSSNYPYEIFVEKNLKNPNGSSNRNSLNKNSGKNENADNIQHFSIKSKLVILGSGAQQKFDTKLKQDILKLIGQNDFFHSDYVLQETGYNHILNNLKLKEKKRIIIIGGSHSGFSCAWILLNGYIDMYKLKEQNKSIRISSPNSKNIHNAALASDGINNNSYANNIHHNGRSYRTKINKNCENCNNYNCCFGYVIDRTWRNSKSASSHVPYNNVCFNSDNLEIQILYRDHIKVYYHSEREALNDGYNVYDQSKAVNKNGNVYPFIGIRGDGKELYRKIVTGMEKRVKLQKCNNFNDQKNFITMESIVIWACGYTTQKMNFFDAGKRNKESDIEFHTDSNNQFDVDKDLHVLNKKKNPFINLFGIGQGYSTHSIEVLSNGKYARADSVNLYNTYISKKLFRSLDIIFNFTAENSNLHNNEKENTKKNNVTSHVKNNSNSNITNKNNTNNTINKNLTKQQSIINSNASNNNENQQQKNKENGRDSSNKKINQTLTNDNLKLVNHNSNNINNNITFINNNGNANNPVNSNISKKSNSQIIVNQTNLKTVKVLSNTNNTPQINNNLDSKKIIKNSVVSNSAYKYNNNNMNNNQVGSNYNSNNLLFNDLIKSHGNLKDKNGKNLSNSNLFRASYSRGFDNMGNSSKSNFFKSQHFNETRLENINQNSKGGNLNNNANIDFSPITRGIKCKSPINVHVSETIAVNCNYPSKKETSRINGSNANTKQTNINFSNANNNITIQNPSKTNPIKKNYSNLNNIGINNMNNYNLGNGGINNNMNNLNSLNNQNNLTPNIYTNKNVIISRDYSSKSPKNINNGSNYIGTGNIDMMKNSYKDLNYKEKNLIGTNSSYLRKSNASDFSRNQVYFGKTLNNGNIKNPNSNSQSNISSSDINNINNNNFNHVKLPSCNSPPLDKPSNKFQISPISYINRNRSKYILYDSTKNNMMNANNNQNYGLFNINENVNSQNIVNLLGKI